MNDYIIRGSFQIPASMPVGRRLVRFTGEDPNSVAEASYYGDHIVTTDTVRTIRTTTLTSNWRLMTTRTTRIWADPLAQTFTLPQNRWLGAVDLYFTKLGSKAVRVQLRTVSLGMPTEEAVTEAYLTISEIRRQRQRARDGQCVRFTFDPVYVEAGTTMAVVVLTDDSVHELAIARLGEFDQAGRAWVRAQPDQMGVLLSSSNAQAWTVHQDADLKYCLLGLNFDPLASKTLSATTSEPLQFGLEDTLMLRATTQQNQGENKQCTFRIQDGGNTLELSANTMLTLTKPIEQGSFEVEMAGSLHDSPLIYPDVQLHVGRMIDQAVYVSRLITLPKHSNKVVVKFDMAMPDTLQLQDIMQISLQPFGSSGAWEQPWDLLELFDVNRHSAGQACEAILNLSAAQKQAEAVQLQLLLRQPAESKYRPELRNLHVVIHEG